MALVGNILLGTGAAPGMSSIASAYAESAASSRIPWSALEYSGQTITAISGSAIGGQGGGDTSQCMPKSASADFYTTSNPSGFITGVDLGPYAFKSSLSSKQDKLTFGYDGANISSIDGSALAGVGNVTPADVSAIASSYANDKLDKTASSTFQPSGNYAYQSSLSSYLPKSASSNFAPAGDYAYNSSLTGYLKNSASSTWYPKTGNPSGFLTAHQSLSGYVPKSSISAQSATWNTVTAKVPKSDISGRSATWNTVSAMVPKSAISAQSATWNTVSAKLDKSAFTSYTATAGGHTYTGVSPVVVNNDTDLISLSATAVHLDSSLKTYNSGTSAMVGLTYPTRIVTNSSQATANNVIYIVTGSN